jgi:hypothetical protein
MRMHGLGGTSGFITICQNAISACIANGGDKHWMEYVQSQTGSSIIYWSILQALANVGASASVSDTTAWQSLIANTTSYNTPAGNVAAAQSLLNTDPNNLTEIAYGYAIVYGKEYFTAGELAYMNAWESNHSVTLSQFVTTTPVTTTTSAPASTVAATSPPLSTANAAGTTQPAPKQTVIPANTTSAPVPAPALSAGTQASLPTVIPTPIATPINAPASTGFSPMMIIAAGALAYLALKK